MPDVSRELLDVLLSLDAPRRPSPDEAARLVRYAARLVEHPRPNLTAARTVASIIEVLIVPSLVVGEAWPRGRPAPRVVLDIGSGNGFPGLAAAALWPGALVHLVERRQRKAAALAEHVAACGYGERVRVHAADSRDLLAHEPGMRAVADLVVLRAVGPLSECNRLAVPFLAGGGRVVHWKGPGISRHEIAEGRRGAGPLGLEECPPLPGVGTRSLWVYERSGGTDATR